MNSCTYYVYHNGIVYLRPIVGWKNARKAAKRLHSNAFIMDKNHFERKKKRRADRERRAMTEFQRQNHRSPDMADAMAYALARADLHISLARPY